jgi:hypothetical protein
VRYAHLGSSPNTWESVGAELFRVDGPPDPTGRCSASVGGKETIKLSLPAGQTSQEAAPLCLEEGQRYQIKLNFQQYDPAQPSQASIYVDSVSFASFTQSFGFGRHIFLQEAKCTIKKRTYVHTYTNSGLSLKTPQSIPNSACKGTAINLF